MPDVPVRPKPDPEPTLAERAEPALTAARVLLTGDPNGRVRRPLLFLTAVGGLFVLMADSAFGLLGLVAGVAAAIAILLLAWTDNTVG